MIKLEEKLELENHHFCTNIVKTGSGKNRQ
jgi:hypothetical protein